MSPLLSLSNRRHSLYSLMKKLQFISREIKEDSGQFKPAERDNLLRGVDLLEKAVVHLDTGLGYLHEVRAFKKKSPKKTRE